MRAQTATPTPLSLRRRSAVASTLIAGLELARGDGDVGSARVVCTDHPARALTSHAINSVRQRFETSLR
jgi:hypothetical protein